MNTNDKFEKIFQLQYDAQISRGMPGNESSNMSKQAYINLMSLAIIDEVMEFLHETNWKYTGDVIHGWKNTKKTVSHERIRSELSDIMHFIINLYLVNGISADQAFEDFKIKHTENIKRHSGDY